MTFEPYTSTMTVETTCSTCQGMGTVGGSFPGHLGPYTPGETCWRCNGSGKETIRNAKVRITPLPPERPRFDATDTDFTDVFRVVNGRMLKPASTQRMQDVATTAKTLSESLAAHRADPSAKNVALVLMHRQAYKKALKDYTDPFRTKNAWTR